MPSPFVWYDLMTTDKGAAKAFYENVVGWNIADSGMPGMDYLILRAGEDQVGGMMPMPPTATQMGAPPMWNGYVHVDDVDVSTRRVKELGGTICQEPMDIPGVGRFSVVADPDGAVFQLFKDTSGSNPVKREMGTPGHIAWRELSHKGLDKAWAFYSALFGWTKSEAFDMGPMGTYQTFSAGDEPMTGGMGPAQDGNPANWMYYFAVEALDAALARVGKGGGKVMMEPMEVPGGAWVAACADPQGAMFGLLADKR